MARARVLHEGGAVLQREKRPRRFDRDALQNGGVVVGVPLLLRAAGATAKHHGGAHLAVAGEGAVGAQRLAKAPQERAGSSTLALTYGGASPHRKGQQKMDNLMAELEQSQIPIGTALKDVVK